MVIRLINEIYLDNAATTRAYPEVAQAVYDMLTKHYGNPSSLHKKGMEAEQYIKKAREQIALALKCQPQELYFTSGGTEASNLALFGAAEAGKKRGNRIITSKIEHSSVLNAFKALEERGFEVCYLNVTQEGIIDINQLAELSNYKTILVSIMHVNNETGVIQPIDEVVRMVRKNSPNAIIHTDLVQSFLKTGFKPTVAGVDMASISAHKLHGPKGVGAVYIKKGRVIRPMMFGGGHENGIRPGTENVPGIVGFGKAVELSVANNLADINRISRLREQLIAGLNNIDGVAINGSGCAPHIINASFNGIKAEVLLHALEAKNVYVSSGSACSSNKPSPSHVLTAMGVGRRQIDGAIRFSLSAMNTDEDIAGCLKELATEIKALRR